jgi:(4S)-4-hydroxy-5-phosphonooxypentane-2,3-dione isomerase
MFILIVQVQVKPETVEAFRTAILDNASNTLKEPGVVRFDVLQQHDDPTRFALYEVYREQEDWMRHKETAHYLRWRDTVADMMAEPRTGTRYTELFPQEKDW